MAERTLNELVQQAEQLSTHMDEGGEELPRVDRSLSQILHSAQSIFAPTVSTPSGNHDAQASILLGSRGLDLLHMSHHLEALSSARTLEPVAAAPDIDVVAFLKNERHNAIIAAIEDARRQTSAEAEHLFWEQQKSEWEQAKQKFMGAFTKINVDRLNIVPMMQDSLASSLTSCGKVGSLNIQEAAYAKVISDYNAEVLHGGIKPNLAQLISDAVASFNDQNVSDLWSLVCSIVDVPMSVRSDSTHRCSPKVQSSLVRQARKYLERSYERHMRSLVYAQLEKAKLGGVPGVVPLVKAYLSVVLPVQSRAHLEDGKASDAPLWPLIFYCLRVGKPKAAAIAAQENSTPSVVEIVPMLEQLEKSETGRLPPDLEKKLKLSYKRSTKGITDPFKRAVYCLLCRCDVANDHSEIVVTTDDYVWFKLSLVEFDDPLAAPPPSTAKGKLDDTLTFTQLQHLLHVQYGEKHFNALQQPLLYMSVLLLTGQFEVGIEFLSRLDHLRCHAVHVALALHEVNLLVLSSKVNAPLLSTEHDDREGVHRLNLVQLVKLYAHKFETTNPLEALHYYFFLRHLPGESQNMFHECISGLVMQSREFTLLLGSLNPDSSRTLGLVDKFKVDVCEITEVVARDSEKKGLHEDAIKLYDLAKNHEKTLCLLNQLLSQVVHLRGPSQGSDHGSKRERALQMGTAIAHRFKTHGHSASPPAIATLHLLLDLSTFFDLYHGERFTEAIEVLKKLNIIALSREEVDARVTGVTSLGLEVKSVLPHLLLAAMTATYRLYQAPVEVPSTPPAKGILSPLTGNISVLNMSTQLLPSTKHLKDQARSIVTYAGMIPLRLNADVNASLVQLEALIN